MSKKITDIILDDHGDVKPWVFFSIMGIAALSALLAGLYIELKQ